MSLPPETITVKVKRKRGEDSGPVNFLRVEESKRQRSAAWLYQRKQAGVLVIVDVDGRQDVVAKPVIHASKVGAENKPLKAHSVAAASPSGHIVNTDTAAATPMASYDRVRREPRRFHMTRSDLPSSLTSTLKQGLSKRSRHQPAVFVERTGKRKKRDDPVVRNQLQESMQPEHSSLSRETDLPSITTDETTTMVSRPFKRPGLAYRLKANSSGTTRAKPQLPKSLLSRQDADMEQLAKDMDAYTLEQITFNLARAEEDTKNHGRLVTLPRIAVSSTKYRPKAPPNRYAERCPEVDSQAEARDVEMLQSDTEDEDYVLETFLRVPASALTHPVPLEQVGLLVFDTDPDVEIFYGGASDSDDEYAEDDEDSNAEDYYTADYPDDEVEDDDEFDRNPYRYRTSNASDLEEFDEQAAPSSGDDDDLYAAGLERLQLAAAP